MDKVGNDEVARDVDLETCVSCAGTGYDTDAAAHGDDPRCSWCGGTGKSTTPVNSEI